MPYIPPDLRHTFRPTAPTANVETPGILNYQITSLLNEFVKKNGVSYNTFNAAIGAIEAAKLEFNRRVVAPYEDAKLEENGDVYD